MENQSPQLCFFFNHSTKTIAFEVWWADSRSLKKYNVLLRYLWLLRRQGHSCSNAVVIFCTPSEHGKYKFYWEVIGNTLFPFPSPLRPQILLCSAWTTATGLSGLGLSLAVDSNCNDSDNVIEVRPTYWTFLDWLSSHLRYCFFIKTAWILKK